LREEYSQDKDPLATAGMVASASHGYLERETLNTLTRFPVAEKGRLITVMVDMGKAGALAAWECDFILQIGVLVCYLD